MQNFTESQFRSKIDAALSTVRTVLDTTKHPKRPSDCPHVWDDKYQVVERAGKATVAALVTCLDVLGANADGVDQMMSWAIDKQSVTIQLSGKETCSFIKKTTREVESATKLVTEKSGILGKSKTTHKTVTTITEHHWKWTYEYTLYAYPANKPGERVEFQGRTGTTTIITTSEKSPHPSTRVIPGHSCNITWLIERLIADNKKSAVDDLFVSFAIDREHKNCHTPRRNAEVDAALRFASRFYSFASSVESYLRTAFSKQALDKLDMSAISGTGLFVPVIPLMVDDKSGEGESQALMPAEDEASFLKEQRRAIEAKLAALAKTFPDSPSLVTVAEANIITTLQHAKTIMERFCQVVDYIEHLIEQQLIAAVGKIVQPKDFAEYMEFHCRKLFGADFAPKPFVHAVRRPDHCPEGILSIEADVRDGALEQPVQTLCCTRQPSSSQPMYFALGAATRAAFLGAQHLHGLVLHQFSGDTGTNLRLTARARQFSSFVLLIGKMVSADTFKPTHGVIIQNKDEIILSLLLEQIPSAKQFRDAIESLSPEMQRFAKMFRAMQLESSMFAMCVIQIKPQMETLLKLPSGALTKEIRLTQDLMELFITYQVPSDLLSYDGLPSASVESKIAAVKKHVKALQDMIEDSKKKELHQVSQEAAYTVLDSIATSSAVPARPKMMMSRSVAAPRMMSASAMASGPAPSAAFAAVSAPAPPPPAASSSNSAPPPADGDAADEPKEDSLEAVDAGDLNVVIDYTKIPAAIDNLLDTYAAGETVRPTTIKPATTWRKKFQKKLLAQPTETSLGKDALHTEKNRAFDLLDALSKSGALPLGHCDLHIVLCSTHTFDKTLLHTVTRDNVNPIEKAEATAILIAAAVHDTAPKAVVRDAEWERVTTYSPLLLNAPDVADADDDNADK